MKERHVKLRFQENTDYENNRPWVNTAG